MTFLYFLSNDSDFVAHKKCYTSMECVDTELLNTVSRKIVNFLALFEENSPMLKNVTSAESWKKFFRCHFC